MLIIISKGKNIILITFLNDVNGSMQVIAVALVDKFRHKPFLPGINNGLAAKPELFVEMILWFNLIWKSCNILA